MKVLIIGNKGNMGRRYTAILKYLGHETLGIDLPQVDPRVNKDELIGALEQADAVIIATPTHTHLNYIRQLVGRKFKKPILCEKPIICHERDMPLLEEVLAEVQQGGMNLEMVDQYMYLVHDQCDVDLGCECARCTKTDDSTRYNYYHSGNDGLAWDCINLIWHGSKGKTSLSNNAPIWECTINGQPLEKNDIDYSYVSMIMDWIDHNGRSLNTNADLLLKHQKVVEYIREHPEIGEL